MGLFEQFLSQRADAANNLAIPETAVCYFCLEGNEDTKDHSLVRGCACRGDSGFLHVECLAAFADIKSKEYHERGDSDYEPWTTCSTCRQPYEGKLNADLSRVHYEMYKNLNPKDGSYEFQTLRSALDHIGSVYMDKEQPEKALEFIQRKHDIEEANVILLPGGSIKYEWFNPAEIAGTCNSLGGCHHKMEKYDKAMDTYEQGLEYIRQAKACQSDFLDENPEVIVGCESYLLNNIAEVHVKRYEFKKAVKVRRRMLSLRERASGKDSFPYAQGCFSLACVLVDSGKLDEGVDLVKESKDIAQRILGPHHHHVMKCDAFLSQLQTRGGTISSSFGQIVPNKAIVVGLKSRFDLNGQRVEVSNYNPDTGRYKASVTKANKQKESVAIKPANLILDKGVKVVIRGLVSAKELNGKHGEVLRFHDNLSRYTIRLLDESDKEIGVKPENAIAY